MAINPKNDRKPVIVARNERPAENREPTMIWLNVGYTAVNPETGEETFVSLPMGVPVDTMKAAPIRGSNEDFIALTQAKNELLEQLQKMGEEMAEGETEILDGLEIQIRRVQPVAAAAAADNPYSASLSKLSFASRRTA